MRHRRERQRLIQAVGREVSRYQDSSYEFDQAAAEVLALQRNDLSCMTVLLFHGPASADELAAALHVGGGLVSNSLERLQLAGYARFQPDGGPRVELTEHARKWIELIWTPLRVKGNRLLSTYPTRHLAIVSAFLRQAREIQDEGTKRLRTWLALPSSPARRPHLRGGLSPAALRRVQLFVEANLESPIHLHDLAVRAALSPYHFARAFKTSAGMTPRAFIEHRRIERAKQLLAESAQPVAEIALATGFGTQSRFTTIFKRATEFTPAAYRRGRS